MPESGVALSEEDDLSRKIRSQFERVRVAYLSARDDPKNYKVKWERSVDNIRGQWDDTDELARTYKKFVTEDDLYSDDIRDPTSSQAKRLYEGVKQMRFSSLVEDPFSNEYGDNVLEELLEEPTLFAQFIHWASRNDDSTLDWEKHDLLPDKLTDGVRGLDLEKDDIVNFISQHYGDEKDLSRLNTKFNGAYKLLDKIMGDDLEEVMEISKSEAHFLVPNKPMYRIFDIDDINELKGFTGEWVVQEKYDGMRVQIHKIDGEVRIYSFNGKDITTECPEQVKLIKKPHFGDCILDAELMLFDGDEPLHRAEVVARIFKDKKSDTILRCHAFDIMRHNDEDLVDSPLKERIKTLFNNYSQHSHELMAFPSKKDTRIADNLKDVERYSKEIMEIPTAEGVVIKDIESTYFIGTKKNPKWIKWKKFVDLDLIVLDSKETKSGMFNYLLGAGPVLDEDVSVVEYDNERYTPVGYTVNTTTEVDKGSIVRVKVDEVKRSKEGYKVHNANVIELPEVEIPEKLVTLRLLSEDTKKSISYKTEALTKGILITDHIHGEAIMKADLNGFIHFEHHNLMSKNALLDIDLWKEEVSQIYKEKKGYFRVGVFNIIKDLGDLDIDSLVKEIQKNPKLAMLYEELFDGKKKNLNNYLRNQAEEFSYDGKKFSAKDDIIEKYKTPDEIRLSKFKLYEAEDGNLQFLVQAETLIAWTIKVTSVDDVFNLFGKTKKFPAMVTENISRDKLIDEGDVELGVQRHGYHEYILDGNKFDTKLHFRVLPLKGEKYWLAFTSIKTEPVDEESDEGVWNINLDKYKDLSFEELN